MNNESDFINSLTACRLFYDAMTPPAGGFCKLQLNMFFFTLLLSLSSGSASSEGPGLCGL